MVAWQLSVRRFTRVIDHVATVTPSTRGLGGTASHDRQSGKASLLHTHEPDRVHVQIRNRILLLLGYVPHSDGRAWLWLSSQSHTRVLIS